MAKQDTFLEAAAHSEKKGDLPKAATLYETHLQKKPDDDRALLKLAEVRERLGESKLAAESFSKLGELYERQGFDAKATAVYRRSLQLVPNLAGTRRLIDVLAKSGKKSDALLLLERTIREAQAKGDVPTRLDLLERVVEIDGGATAALSLADALVETGKRADASTRLRAFSVKFKRQGPPGEQLRVFERLVLLNPDDRELALEAGKLAISVTDPRRALTSLRPCLDFHTNDPELIALAADALDQLGDGARGALVHREAARQFGRAKRPKDAQEEWLKVLAHDPADEEAKAAIAPPPASKPASKKKAAPPPPPPPAPSSPAPAPKPAPVRKARPGNVSAVFSLEVSLDDLTTQSLSIDRDPAPPVPGTTGPPPDSAAAGDVVELVQEAKAPAESVRPGGPGSPKSAVVVADGPEAGWIARSLQDLGVAVSCVGTSEVEAALQRATESAAGLVFVPPAAAEEWQRAGGWQVLSLVASPRSAARKATRAAKVPTLESKPVPNPEALGHAFSAWGSPLDLVGSFGQPARLSQTGAPALHLKLAEERFHSPVEAQPACQTFARVLVFGDGKMAVALAEWRQTLVEGTKAIESPFGPGEEVRLAVAVEAALAMKLRGAAVVVLGQYRDVWLFESMETQWGPAALAVEARCGLSVIQALVELTRGQPLPPPPPRRGVALAAWSATNPASVANLRIEPAPDSASFFLCAHAQDREQALKRLVRGLSRQ